MESCPTCGAAHRGGPSCHRCQTDLKQVLVIEQAAARHARQALRALGNDQIADARAYAQRACALHWCRESLAARAMVALREGEFATALRLWRETLS